jgi:hypothetical protein
MLLDCEASAKSIVGALVMQACIIDNKFSEMEIFNDQNIGENISMIKLMLPRLVLNPALVL